MPLLMQTIMPYKIQFVFICETGQPGSDSGVRSTVLPCAWWDLGQLG
jgi:hypothetical protein